MDFLLDAFLDTLKVLPFLFITYLFIEWMEHHASVQWTIHLKKSKRLGPLFGSFFGLFPQCGFSTIASTLYRNRIITFGTLIAIYLTTSDEMIPVLLSNGNPSIILPILGIKFGFGLFFGFLLDFTLKRNVDDIQNEALCLQENCQCHHEGIFISALKHTFQIALYLFLITFLLNVLLDTLPLASWLEKSNFLGIVLSALIGLIPNCAASIVIVELYSINALSFGTMIAGLLTNTGVGLLVLFRTNKNLKENLFIIFTLFIIGILGGLLFTI